LAICSARRTTSAIVPRHPSGRDAGLGPIGDNDGNDAASTPAINPLSITLVVELMPGRDACTVHTVFPVTRAEWLTPISITQTASPSRTRELPYPSAATPPQALSEYRRGSHQPYGFRVVRSMRTSNTLIKRWRGLRRPGIPGGSVSRQLAVCVDAKAVLFRRT
jgi:hypothetical protein